MEVKSLELVNNEFSVVFDRLLSDFDDSESLRDFLVIRSNIQKFLNPEYYESIIYILMDYYSRDYKNCSNKDKKLVPSKVDVRRLKIVYNELIVVLFDLITEQRKIDPKNNDFFELMINFSEFMKPENFDQSVSVVNLFSEIDNYSNNGYTYYLRHS